MNYKEKDDFIIDCLYKSKLIRDNPDEIQVHDSHPKKNDKPIFLIICGLVAIPFTIFLACLESNATVQTHKQTVCQTSLYAGNIENKGSLIPNTPTPTITGECGSAYVSQANSSNWSRKVSEKENVLVSNQKTYDYSKFFVSINPLEDDFMPTGNYGARISYAAMGALKHDSYIPQKLYEDYQKFYSPADQNLMNNMFHDGFPVYMKKDNNNFIVGIINPDDNKITNHIIVKNVSNDILTNMVARYIRYINREYGADSEEKLYFVDTDSIDVNVHPHVGFADPISEYVLNNEINSNNRNSETNVIQETENDEHNNVSLNNIDKILSSNIGRFNAFNAINVEYNNASYWYQIHADGDIAKMLLNPSKQKIVSMEVIKTKDNESIVHIIWLEEDDHDIKNIVMKLSVHNAVVIMPVNDFTTIQKSINAVNMNHSINTDSTENEIWNTMSNEDVIKLANHIWK